MTMLRLAEHQFITRRWGRRLLLSTGMLAVAVSAGCSPPAADVPAASQPVRAAVSASRDYLPEITRFCGDCHVLPRPESFPKAAWEHEVRRGYEFYFESGRNDLSPPPQAPVVDYFRNRAPESLSLPAESERGPSSPIRFRGESFSSTEDGKLPAISFVDWNTTSGHGAFLLSDMRNGSVLQLSPRGETLWQQRDLAAHPAAVRVCDLNHDGLPDLVAADLGSFQPEDHQGGRVVWLGDYRAEAAKPIVILDKIGRVADLRPGDFDRDGRLDLVVAEFGWHTTGGIHVLYNRPGEDAAGTPRFDVVTVDRRPGTIHVLPVDLNRDGRLDFVALISQEHEKVVAFLNQPEGFRKVDLYAAPDPSWGSSGIEVIDFDGDGDVDVLLSNGDTFDSNLIKPYHGISWLENTGDLKFTAHPLTRLPGAHRALPCDLDGDGDLDLAVCALLPSTLMAGQSAANFDAVIWLEQTSPGQFVRHSIARGSPSHAAMSAGDFDGDSDIDLAVGVFLSEHRSGPSRLMIYWNEGRAEPSAHGLAD